MKTDEISLWCDAESFDDGNACNKHKRKDGRPSSKLEEDVDEHYNFQTDKHGDTYTVPQRRL